MSFEDLIGNEKNKANFIDIINRGNISNSYMFIGQEGIGKEKFAKEFAKRILCLLSNKNKCLDNCESCLKFNSQNHPDFEEVELDGNSIKISQIRKLQDNVYIKPIISPKKVFIINNADKMTQEAQNSLLKTLEEPPRYIVLILIVANENLLLNTIKSRCIKLYFSNLQRDEILKYINKNKTIENPTTNIIDLCNGSIGKLESIKNNINSYDEVEKFLNDLMNNKFSNIIEVNKNAEILYKSKDIILSLLEYMIVIFFNEIKNVKICDLNIYAKIIETIEKTKNKINMNVNYDMCIDEMLYKIYFFISNLYNNN